ncbi:MAG: methylated-DNA--[protein]-cysteine S-methyltransferase [Comamonadaceae bacterium]|nr:MAG: methylated-DNA--[protein]-cysteine S-methyltransferase [Comamonadaceae bacterium]
MKFDIPLVQTDVDSPLGRIILAATPQGLAGLWFDDQRHLPPELLPVAPGARRQLLPAWPADASHPVLQETRRQLADYFAGHRTRFELPLDLGHGTAFQQSVWQALLAIPAGATTSYGELSRRIGHPAAVRAVGAAVGRNPVSIIVPCHRVMGAGGALTGYAGGLARKSALLQLEGALAEALL